MIQPPQLLLAALATLIFPSCATMYMKDHGFRETAAVGAGTLDGPFLWRIEAEGLEGVHKYLCVSKIRVTTETTKRDEWYPRSNLNLNALFEKDPKNEGKTFAQ